MIRPFFDQAIQFDPGSVDSLFFSDRMLLGVSVPAGLPMLQTRRSPSALCTANMSDFCFDDEACHASPRMGDGALAVERVCKTVKEGKREAIRMDPFLYLSSIRSAGVHMVRNFNLDKPNGESLAVACRRDRGDGVENRPCGLVLRGRGLEQDDFASVVTCYAVSALPTTNFLPSS